MPEDLVTFQFSVVVQLLPWFGGLVAAAGFFVCVRRRTQVVWRVLLGALTLALWAVLGPTLAHDRIEFSGTQYRRQTGLWFAPNDHFIDLARVRERAVASKRTPKGRPYVSDRFIFDDGTFDDVPRGDLYQAHASAIQKLLDERHARARARAH